MEIMSNIFSFLIFLQITAGAIVCIDIFATGFYPKAKEFSKRRRLLIAFVIFFFAFHIFNFFR